MRAGLLIVVGALAAGALVWMLLGDDGVAPQDDYGIEDVDTDGTVDRSLMDADDGAGPLTAERGTNGRGTDLLEARASSSEGIRGTVVDTGGSPIAGATVQVFPATVRKPNDWGNPDAKVLASAAADAQGAFTAGPLPGDTSFRVRAQAQGYAPAEARVSVRGEHVHLVLDRGAALTVRVVSQSGEVVPDARVVHAADDVVTAVTSDDAGVAQFPSLSPGAGRLVVSATGYKSALENSITLQAEEEAERTMVLEPAAMLSGTVVDGTTGKPMTDVQVSVRYPRLPFVAEQPSVKTDHEGKFSIASEGGAREHVQLRATKAGYAEARRTRSGADTSPIELKMFRMLDPFAGSVYDSRGLPAAGALVTYGQHGSMLPDERVPQARTNELGNFELAPVSWAVRGTSYLVVAIGDTGEVGGRYLAVPAKNDAQIRRLDIRLVANGQLHGRVFDGAGKPIAGATVRAEPDWSQRTGHAIHQQLFQALEARKSIRVTTLTDEGGDFVLPMVPAISYQLQASYNGEEGNAREIVQVPPGGTAQMDITLGTSNGIEGTTVDSDRQPLAGVQVRAVAIGRRGTRTRNLRTRSRSDGTFQLRGVAEGTYQLTGTLAGYGGAVVRDVTAGQTNVELELTRQGRVRGQVTQGGPYNGTFTVQAQVSSSGRDEGTMLGRNLGGGTARTFNTKDGSFELMGLAPGTYTLQARTPDGSVGTAGPIEVVNGRDTDGIHIALGQGAAIRGRVLDGSGRPFPRATIQVTPQRGRDDNTGATRGHARVNAKGEYEVKGLGPGAYIVAVWAQGYSWSEAVEVAEGETRPLDLRYKSPGIVEILVVDEDDRPVAGASPDLVSTTGQRVHANYHASKRDGLFKDHTDWERLQRSDDSGRVVRHHVPPGRYEVKARHHNYETPSEGVFVDVTSGSRQRVRVTLAPVRDGNR